MTHYELLGVARTASLAEIKRAYRKLAKHLHPDVGGDPVKFAEINRAHAVLTDPAQRTHYDLTGQDMPPTPVDEVQAKAQDMIFDLLGHMLMSSGETLPRGPVLTVMHAQVSKTLKEIDKRIASFKAAKLVAERMVSRSKRKTEGKPDVVGNSLKRHIESFTIKIANNENGKLVIERALQLIDDHAYEPEVLLSDRPYSDARATYDIYGGQRNVNDGAFFSNLFGNKGPRG